MLSKVAWLSPQNLYKNFPPVCKARQSAVQLKDSFRWRDTEDPGEREDLGRETGKRFSSFDELPGFEPAATSPVEPMHAWYLGKPLYSVELH